MSTPTHNRCGYHDQTGVRLLDVLLLITAFSLVACVAVTALGGARNKVTEAEANPGSRGEVLTDAGPSLESVLTIAAAVVIVLGFVSFAIYRRRVTDGHHRVVAALRVGAPIRYRVIG